MPQIRLSLLILSIISLSHPSFAIAATNRTLNFDLNDSSSIPKGIHGINANWYKFLPIQQSLTQNAISKLGLTQVRFPGGTVGNYYDWSQFAPDWQVILHDPTVPDFVQDSKPYFDFHIQELSPTTFAPILKSLGKDITYVVNFSHNSNAEIIHGLEQLKNQNIDVKRIELGNELYFRDIPSLTENVYLNRAEDITTRAKQLWPTVKTAVVIDPLYWESRLAKGWEIPNKPWYDAVIIHAYSPVFGFNDARYTTWVTGDTNNSESRRYAFAQFIQNIKSNYPSKELWLTEWDISEISTARKFANTYNQTYYVYDFILGLLEYPIITVANHHALNNTFLPKSDIQDKYFQSPYTNHVPNNQYTLNEFFREGSAYWPLVWIGKAMQNSNRFVLDSNPNDTVHAVYFYPNNQSNRGSFAFINRSADPITLNLAGLNLSGGTYKLSSLALSWNSKVSTQSFTPMISQVTTNSIPLAGYAIAYLEPNSSSSSRPGDLNNDSKVNLADYNLLVSNYGTTYNLAHYNQLVANFQP